MSENTMMRRIEQYRDRWSSLGLSTGLLSLSDRLSPADLKEIDIFKEFDDKFLEKMSTDISLATWSEGAVLFEEGSYIDIAFYILEGEVETSLGQTESAASQTSTHPIFDTSISMKKPTTDELNGAGASTGTIRIDRKAMAAPGQTQRVSRNEITFLASMDFNLKMGGAQRLDAGEIFGEIGALSGWPQSVTARAATEVRLLQIRLPALRKLKQKSVNLKHQIDRRYRERSLLSQLKTTPLFNGCPDGFLDDLAKQVELVSCKPDEVIVTEGQTVDALYLIRSGFVKLSQTYGEGEMIASYLSKGMTFGEVELLMDGVDEWTSSALSVEYAELVKIPIDEFQRIVGTFPAVTERLWETAAFRIKEAGFNRKNIRHAEFEQAALDLGLVQGNSILVIDLETCTRCDDCVRACAATHDGRARFVREGPKLDNLMIARSCYHCRDPVCLIGCPTGAIHRAGIGDVVEIKDDVCIGCGTCARGCPYDAIIMHETGATWPGNMIPEGLRGRDQNVASKCDHCAHTGHEPACVTNCPQGCASRVGSLDEFHNLFRKD